MHAGCVLTDKTKNDMSPTRRLNTDTLCFSVSVKSTHKQKVARICGDEYSIFTTFKTSSVHFFCLKTIIHQFLIAFHKSELSL